MALEPFVHRVSRLLTSLVISFKRVGAVYASSNWGRCRTWLPLRTTTVARLAVWERATAPVADH
jgi:hypothetical protein